MSHQDIMRARILIADDNRESLEVLQAFLAESPYEIRTAHDGDEALKLALSGDPT